MDKPHPGMKRKRVDSENLAGDTSRIPGKLHHGLREIRKAAKKAKVFETQKLVKKLKELRIKGEGNTDFAEHEAELSILKGIDHEVFANTATKTKIMKDKVLLQHEQIQESLIRELGDKVLSTTTQGPAAKVHSRLLSSKILATGISSLCDDLRVFLGHEPKKPRIQTGGDDGRLEVPDITKGSAPRKLHHSGVSHVDTKYDVDFEEEEALIDETGWESRTVDEEHDAESWDSGINSLDGEDSADPEIDDEGESENGRRAKPARSEAYVKALRKANEDSSTTSTFLPSLSVGFVRGSDESDWSDNEANIADAEKKKNRRGQRARRAIWEKKYGKNANHKKKESEARDRKARQDGGRGERDGVHRGSQLSGRSNITTKSGNRSRHSEPGPSLLAGAHPRPSAKADEKPLHPSWEAKRKLKEQQSAGIIQSQGTKIKFSD